MAGVVTGITVTLTSTLAGTVTATTAQAATPAATTKASTTASATASGAVTAPALSATARAHGLSTTYGAVPGWTHMHLTAQRHTTAPTTHATTTTSSVNLTTNTTLLPTTSTNTSGMDVSAWSGTVNWTSFKTAGVRYTYVKATEGTYYTSSLEASQTSGARAAGLYVGTYHFANPSQSTGTAQADYFIAHGGGWTPGTLPGAVDLEWNPYSGNSCYNMTTTQMAAWITAFQLEYQHKTGTWPIIYTATNWWNTCVGSSLSSAVIAARSNLWLSALATTPGPMPTGWSTQRIWQYAYNNTGGYSYDQFNGTTTMLNAMAIAGR